MNNLTAATMINVTGIQKSYTQAKKKIHVLKNVSFNVEAGETIAILGKSGSGKSTFLSLISGLDFVDGGSIIIGGENISKMNENELTQYRANKLGIIFQQFHLMDHLNALENVKIALDIAGIKRSKEVAFDFLKEVGLEDRVNHLPSELSGGEKQRVAIARAICVKPQLLLADEPSGNLDEVTAGIVMGALFNLVEKYKQTLILVTHDKELASKCNKIYHLVDGTLKLKS
jgi:putative ABC transport system ATP-binding protein